MNSIQIYETDFGPVILPKDFPGHAFRKNGTVDRRRKIAAALQEYIEDLTAAARASFEAEVLVGGLRAMSWDEWQSKKS